MEFEVHLGVDQDGSGKGFSKREDKHKLPIFCENLESQRRYDCSHFPLKECSANMIVVSEDHEPWP